jgi:hypothetical protein
MSGKEASTTAERASPRSDSIWAALVIGLPIAGCILTYIRQPQFNDSALQRYVSHPVEIIEVVVFCCAISALLFKVWGWLWECRALRASLLPAWNGTPQPPAEARKLLGHVAQLPRSLRRSWVGQRCRTVLDFLCRRGSVAGLDDHVRFVADNDAMSLESSYSFIRFLVWAMPILGFLGTVLGITQAIGGVSPEKLEKDLSSLTGGLATAFDSTGLALLLTMVAMLLTFVAERLEQSVLHGVDSFTDEHLFHRFVRGESDNSPLVAAMEGLVQKQAEVWAESLGQMQCRLYEEEQRIHERVASALQQAIERSLTTHQEQLAQMRQLAQEHLGESLRPMASLAGSLRQQVIALKPMADAMSALEAALARLQQDEGQLVRLQSLLQQNLGTLAAAESFDEAVHNLAAAVHLLTARTGKIAKAA